MNSYCEHGEELAELDLDRVRLEWLVQGGYRVVKAEEGWYGVWSGEYRLTPKDSYPTDWRDSIDQARQRQYEGICELFGL